MRGHLKVNGAAPLIMHNSRLATITAHVGTCVDLSGGCVVVPPTLAINHPSSNQIEDLADVEHHAQHRGAHHEVGENGLLSGPGYVAVHQVGTGTGVALGFPGQLKAVVDAGRGTTSQRWS